MSRRILRDIEEAISREVRRITFHNERTLDFTVLEDTYDPITGENVPTPIEANYYDSSADTNHIQYPHFFVKLLRMKEDLTTGRVIPEYGKEFSIAITTSPKAYQQVLYTSDGLITAAGNVIGTGIFKIRTVLPGYLLRILSGNNKGTYKIATVTPSSVGAHTITLSPDLATSLPAAGFVSATRVVTFLEAVDLNTVKVGDTFTDAGLVVWNITALDPDHASITINGSGAPNLLTGGKISRIGNVLQLADLGLVKFSVMDPTKPVTSTGNCGNGTATFAVNPSIPVDIYYLVRIDSKERASHIDVATRMWEEFNPPRTALPTIIRKRNSAEQLLTVDSTGSPTISVADNVNFNVGDTVFIFDDFTPTKDFHGDGFEDVFTAKVISKSGTGLLTLSKPVPDTFLVTNTTKIVSNAEYRLHMFNFVDHVTKDVEGAQYWSHEFTFWIQAFIDRQGEPTLQDGVIQKIEISGDDIDGNPIYEC